MIQRCQKSQNLKENTTKKEYNLGTYVNLGKYSGSGDGAGGVRETSPAGSHQHYVSISMNPSKPKDAEKSHENKPPFMVLCYIIRCC